MPQHVMSDDDESTIVNALRIAAERYDENAKTLRATSPEGPAFGPRAPAVLERLAAHFDTQAAEARALADRVQSPEGTATAAQISAARDEYASDEINIDDGAPVSETDEGGYWVGAWVWISTADEITGMMEG